MKLYAFMYDLKVYKKQHALQFPYHLADFSETFYKFGEDRELIQHTHDNRSEEEKELIRTHRETHTLKVKSENWNDLPALVAEVKSFQEWKPTLHKIGQQFLMITGAKNPDSEIMYEECREDECLDFSSWTFHEVLYPWRFV